MTDALDYGPIISKISYPILPNDKSIDLFKRILTVGPDFALSSLKLLESIPQKNIDLCEKQRPKIYKRGEFLISNEISEYNHA